VVPVRIAEVPPTMTLQPAPSRALPVPLLASPARRRELRALAKDMVDWVPTDRPRCDLDLLITGAMSPLLGFLGRADYESVLERMRLADGTLWPMPITLDVPGGVAERLRPGDGLALRDHDGSLLAVLWGARFGVRGPTYVGAIGLLIFIINVGSEVGVTPSTVGLPIVGWPLILALVGAGLFVISLIPSVETPDAEARIRGTGSGGGPTGAPPPAGPTGGTTP